MGNEVVEYKQQTVEERFEFARRLSAAEEMLPAAFVGIIDKGKPTQRQGIIPGKVFLITETARMLGLDPLAGIQGINVIEGKVSITPAMMQALVRRAGHKLRVRTEGTIEGGDLKAVATLIRNDDPEPFVVEWTVHDAVRAGLVDSYRLNPDTGLWELRARSSKDKPLPWEAYTRSLLKWRAQGEVVRDGAEEVLLGIHYSPEELGGAIREDGSQETMTAAKLSDLRDDINDKIADAATKEDLVAIWDEWHNSDAWPGEVEARYYVAVGALNEEAAVVVDDAPTESGPAEAEQGRQDDGTASAADNPSETPEAADGRTAPHRSGDGVQGPLGTVAPAGPQGPIGPVHPSILEAEDWEAQQIAEHEARVASGEVEE